MAHLMTATRTGLQYGVQVHNNILTLGQSGRARREIRIPVDPSMGRQPEVGSVTVSGNRLQIGPGEAKDAVVVRVRTEAIYTRGCPGTITLGKGWNILAQGFTAWGDAGGLGSMPDSLLAVRGDVEGVCRIVFSGGRGRVSGGRWLVALQRGCEWPSVVMIDCHEDALPALRPAEVLIDDEPQRVLKMIRETTVDVGTLAEAERTLGKAQRQVTW